MSIRYYACTNTAYVSNSSCGLNIYETVTVEEPEPPPYDSVERIW
jgi:hypothetical protein